MSYSILEKALDFPLTGACRVTHGKYRLKPKTLRISLTYSHTLRSILGSYAINGYFPRRRDVDVSYR